MSERANFLVAVAENLMAEHRKWMESDHDDSTLLENAITETVDLFSRGEIPGHLRQLERAVGRLGDAKANWVEQANAGHGDTMPLTEPIFRALEGIREVLKGSKPRPRRRVETIQELMQQKVSDQQICKILGLLYPDGSPDYERLAEEKENPGVHTHKNPSWLSPAEQAERDRTEREERRYAELKAKIERRTAAKTAPPPESLETLVRQGVSAKQIGAMMHCTEEEVYAECERQGLRMPAAEYEPLSKREGIRRGPAPNAAAVAELERSPGLRAAEGYHEPDVDDEPEYDEEDDQPDYDAGEEIPQQAAEAPTLTLEQRIVGMHQQGKATKEIAEALSCSGQKVGQTVRAYKDHPERFE